MKSKSCIQKGKRFENQVCHEIEQAGLGKAGRTPGSGSGLKKGDIYCNLEFILECKNEKNTNFLPNVDQAKKQAQMGNFDHDKWALVTRDPRSPEAKPEIYVTIDLWQWLELLKKNSEPRVKQPDRDLRYALARLIQAAKEVTKKIPDLIVNELTGFIRTQISEVKKEIISEFIKGKRCFHCGKLKERGLSDWCGKCLEEA